MNAQESKQEQVKETKSKWKEQSKLKQAARNRQLEPIQNQLLNATFKSPS